MHIYSCVKHRPEIEKCDCGQIFDWENIELDDDDIYVSKEDKITHCVPYLYRQTKCQFFGIGVARYCTVYWYECSCNKRHYLDGLGQHVFNIKNNYLIRHELINACSLFLAEHSHSTFAGFVTSQNNIYEMQNELLRLDNTIFREAWDQMTDLQAWENKPICWPCFDPTKHLSINDIQYSAIASDGVSIILQSSRAQSMCFLCFLFLYI